MFYIIWAASSEFGKIIAYASSEGSGEPAHPRSLARTSAARSYKQSIKRNLQTESQIPSPAEWLGMRSLNLSWRNARRHKFAWRVTFKKLIEKSREWQNNKPQPTPDTKRKQKNKNKKKKTKKKKPRNYRMQDKNNYCTGTTRTRPLFPKGGDYSANQDWKQTWEHRAR